MADLPSMLYGAIVGFCVWELLLFFIQLICEKVIVWKCNRLPAIDRQETIDAMIADLRTQRSLIRMLKMAFTGTWYKGQPPKMQDKGEEEIKQDKEEK